MRKIQRRLQEIEQKRSELDKEYEALIEEKNKRKALDKKLEILVEDSGFASAKDLVDALVEKFHLQSGANKNEQKIRRKRTKITKELIKEVKGEAANGQSMNAISKARGVSYTVIAKIIKGGYH